MNNSSGGSVAPAIPRFIFVAGLHRSGTSLLAKALAEHPDIEGFSGTGVAQDEGQYLQSVYPTSKFYRGPGLFGFNPRSRMTETHRLAGREMRDRLLEQWEPYMRPARRYFIEKSPPNILRTRLLQAWFPDAKFVVLFRHPVAATMATKKWSRLPLWMLLQHWVMCNDRLQKDLPFLRSAYLLRYEDFLADPQATIRRLTAFLGLDEHLISQEVRQGINDSYFEAWRALDESLYVRIWKQASIWNLEGRVAKYGYSLRNLRELGPSEILSPEPTPDILPAYQ